MDAVTLPSAEYTIAGRRYHLLVAADWRARMRGLSGLNALGVYDGMLFRFPFAWRWPIHMRGMRFPIRALWLRYGRVVDAQWLPVGSWRWYRPCKKVDVLVEIPLYIN